MDDMNATPENAIYTVPKKKHKVTLIIIIVVAVFAFLIASAIAVSQYIIVNQDAKKLMNEVENGFISSDSGVLDFSPPKTTYTIDTYIDKLQDIEYSLFAQNDIRNDAERLEKKLHICKATCSAIDYAYQDYFDSSCKCLEKAKKYDTNDGQYDTSVLEINEIYLSYVENIVYDKNMQRAVELRQELMDKYSDDPHYTTCVSGRTTFNNICEGHSEVCIETNNDIVYYQYENYYDTNDKFLQLSERENPVFGAYVIGRFNNILYASWYDKSLTASSLGIPQTLEEYAQQNEYHIYTQHNNTPSSGDVAYTDDTSDDAAQYSGDEAETYYNERFGYSVMIPDGFSLGETPTNGDGVTMTDDSTGATFSVSSGNNVIDEKLEECYDKDRNDVDCSYSYLGSNYYIVSWLDENDIVYEKRYVRDMSITTFILKYSSFYRDIYDKMIDDIMGSIVLGPDESM